MPSKALCAKEESDEKTNEKTKKKKEGRSYVVFLDLAGGIGPENFVM